MALGILLVEDNAADAALLQALLQEERRLVLEVVGSRAEAIRRLRERPFAAVLLDLNLPDSRGLQTVEGIVAAHPEVPVVVLTGFAGSDAHARRACSYR